MKRCTKCKELKPDTEFWKDSRYYNKTISQCKLCKSKSAKAWRMKNPNHNKERYAANTRSEAERHLKKKYGINLKIYDTLLKKQNGVCAICGSSEPKTKRFDVDHDHKTGIVRGLLCTQCNRMLGHGRDDTAILSNAIKYLSSRKSLRNL